VEKKPRKRTWQDLMLRGKRPRKERDDDETRETCRSVSEAYGFWKSRDEGADAASADPGPIAAESAETAAALP
jgi:hypothetical protein